MYLSDNFYHEVEPEFSSLTRRSHATHVVAWSAPIHNLINADMLLTGTLLTNFNKTWIEMQQYSYKNEFHNAACKMSAGLSCFSVLINVYPDSKVHGVLPAPDGPQVGPMNLAIRVVTSAPADNQQP